MIRLLTWALAIGGVLAYGYFTDVGRDDSGTVVKAGESNVTDLRVGDCLNIFDEEETVTQHLSFLAIRLISMRFLLA